MTNRKKKQKFVWRIEGDVQLQNEDKETENNQKLLQPFSFPVYTQKTTKKEVETDNQTDSVEMNYQQNCENKLLF